MKKVTEESSLDIVYPICRKTNISTPLQTHTNKKAILLSMIHQKVSYVSTHMLDIDAKYLKYTKKAKPAILHW